MKKWAVLMLLLLPATIALSACSEADLDSVVISKALN